jgi:hypothetical protein
MQTGSIAPSTTVQARMTARRAGRPMLRAATGRRGAFSVSAVSGPAEVAADGNTRIRSFNDRRQAL